MEYEMRGLLGDTPAQQTSWTGTEPAFVIQDAATLTPTLTTAGVPFVSALPTYASIDLFVSLSGTLTGAATIRAYLVNYNPTTGAITSILGTSPEISLASAPLYAVATESNSRITFTFQSPISVTLGTSHAIAITYTPNGATQSVYVNYHSSAATIYYYSGSSVTSSIANKTFRYVLTAPSQGETGATGESGTSGESGSTGASGISGTSGSTGASGTSGESGSTGASGTSGESGATGESGESVITSRTGSHWILPDNVPTYSYTACCWSPALATFCLVTSTGPVVLFDGVVATTHTPATPFSNWSTVCWSAELGLFCGFASNSGQPAVLTSVDGITWIITIFPFLDTINRVCWSPELRTFCAVGGDQTYLSANGILWTPIIPRQSFDSICWSSEERMFCAIVTDLGLFDGNGSISLSSDGWTWSAPVIVPNPDTVAWSSELRAFVLFGSVGGIPVEISIIDDKISTQTLSGNAIPQASMAWSPELRTFCVLGDTNTTLTTR